EGVVHTVDGTAACVGGHRGEERRIRDSESNLFAFHVAAALQDGNMLVYSGQQGIAPRLRPICSRNSCKEEEGHRREDCPAVPLRLGHPAQRVSESCRDYEYREDLEKVADRRGVLEGMGAIGVEESAAIRSQHLDGFL